MSKPFTLYLRVRYAECDAQKVVFNGKYAEYADVAATEFTRALWGGYQRVLDSGLDNQVVNLTIDWFSPAVFDDVLAIEVKTERIGTTSYALGMKIKRHSLKRNDTVLVASASLTYVLVDVQNYKKVPIPENLRSALVLGAAGVSINQSGAAIT